MGKLKTSPAPWKVEYLGLYKDGNIIEWITCINGAANIVYSPPEHEYTSREIWDANSKLIAAAPELYEALEDAINRRPGWILRAKAALKKAKGE